jgi:hypothetical protein
MSATTGTATPTMVFPIQIEDEAQRERMREKAMIKIIDMSDDVKWVHVMLLVSVVIECEY